MKIQLNSDNTIAVDARLTRFVEGEVSRLLGRFDKRLTRVEVHLSDVDNQKTGRADKRCLIEARPMGGRPCSTSARATTVPSAAGQALAKMQRSLTTFFGRRGRPSAAASVPVSPAKEMVATKANGATENTAGVKTAAAKKPAKLSSRGPKKKLIYQARRKSWPAR